MSFRYIGSKARVTHEIGRYIERWPGTGRFVDAFCGTGAISSVAAGAGWPVHLNDSLACATTMASARLMAATDVPFRSFGGYDAAIMALNEVLPREGFIWREYSPASIVHLGIERRYFREWNAARIDGIRAAIGSWKAQNLISVPEERLLIADLLSAATRVANIAGTYGCFLAKWTKQSDEPLTMTARPLLGTQARVTITTQDAGTLNAEAADLVYLDPPYTKRQYASYYHLLETITLGDTPRVGGVGGLRPWRELASDFCYKPRALPALTKLIRGLRARRLLLSYSDEAHIPISALHAALGELGTVDLHVVRSIGRYRPNQTASLNMQYVREYLFVLKRDEVASDEALSA